MAHVMEPLAPTTEMKKAGATLARRDPILAKFMTEAGPVRMRFSR